MFFHRIAAGLGIAIPGQFADPGIRVWRRRDPVIREHNAHVIRESNTGPTFSIPGFRVFFYLFSLYRAQHERVGRF